MNPVIRSADSAAIEAYRRSSAGGAEHEYALNIAVSIWFCRCPQIDTRLARQRVRRLLGDVRAAA
jgi:hypothetical protein